MGASIAAWRGRLSQAATHGGRRGPGVRETGPQYRAQRYRAQRYRTQRSSGHHRPSHIARASSPRNRAKKGTARAVPGYLVVAVDPGSTLRKCTLANTRYDPAETCGKVLTPTPSPSQTAIFRIFPILSFTPNPGRSAIQVELQKFNVARGSDWPEPACITHALMH